MDGARHQFFAGATGPGDQYRGRAWSYELDEPENLLHLARRSTQLTERAGIPQPAPRTLQFGAGTQQRGCILQHRPQPLRIDGLSNVVVGAQTHRLNRAVDRALRSHQNHRHGLSLLRQSLQQFDASHTRHLEVCNHDGGIPLRRFFKSLGTVDSGFSAVAPGGNQFGEPGTLVFFIFNNQYLFVAHPLVLVRPSSRDPSPSLALRLQTYAASFLWSKVRGIRGPQRVHTRSDADGLPRSYPMSI